MQKLKWFKSFKKFLESKDKDNILNYNTFSDYFKNNLNEVTGQKTDQKLLNNKGKDEENKYNEYDSISDYIKKNLSSIDIDNSNKLKNEHWKYFNKIINDVNKARKSEVFFIFLLYYLKYVHGDNKKLNENFVKKLKDKNISSKFTDEYKKLLNLSFKNLKNKDKNKIIENIKDQSYETNNIKHLKFIAKKTSDILDNILGIKSREKGEFEIKIKHALEVITNTYNDLGGSEKENTLNILAVRYKPWEIDAFKDILLIGFPIGDGKYNAKAYECSTLPGSTYLMQKSMNKDGTAILTEQQFNSKAFINGKHKGYKALVQNAPLKIKRINPDKIENKDDLKKEYENANEIKVKNAGLNIHRTVKEGQAESVKDFSAGCIVIKNADDYDELMKIADNFKVEEPFPFALVGENYLDEKYIDRIEALKKQTIKQKGKSDSEATTDSDEEEEDKEPIRSTFV